MGMESQAWDVRQQSVFGKEPEPDIGAKIRQQNPEPTRAEVKAAQPKRAKGEDNAEIHAGHLVIHLYGF